MSIEGLAIPAATKNIGHQHSLRLDRTRNGFAWHAADGHSARSAPHPASLVEAYSPQATLALMTCIIAGVIMILNFSAFCTGGSPCFEIESHKTPPDSRDILGLFRFSKVAMQFRLSPRQ